MRVEKALYSPVIARDIRLHCVFAIKAFYCINAGNNLREDLVCVSLLPFHKTLVNKRFSIMHKVIVVACLKGRETLFHVPLILRHAKSSTAPQAEGKNNSNSLHSKRNYYHQVRNLEFCRSSLYNTIQPVKKCTS